MHRTIYGTSDAETYLHFSFHPKMNFHNYGNLFLDKANKIHVVSNINLHNACYTCYHSNIPLRIFILLSARVRAHARTHTYSSANAWVITSSLLPLVGC
jgi:hypothetical protein